MNTTSLVCTAVVLTLAVLLGWVWQLYSKKADIADTIWAYGIGGSAVYYAVVGYGAVLPRLIVGILAGVWFFRLGTYILLRVWHEPEDGRYQAMREHYGDRSNVFYFFFFLGQALAAWVFALPMWVIAHSPVSEFNIWMLIAVGVTIIAFTGESLADRQLAAFRRDPANRGKTCRRGLWRYSRHPNYFFEWVHWFVYPVLAWGAPFAPAVWLATIAMFFFLYYVTGIPYTERQAIKSRGEDYRDYQRTTSAFIPWRPKS